MTRRLLDDFAMTAMHNLLQSLNTPEGAREAAEALVEQPDGTTFAQHVAKRSYDYAEAMVKERSIRLKKGEL